jgi:hypothetical protein
MIDDMPDLSYVSSLRNVVDTLRDDPAGWAQVVEEERRYLEGKVASKYRQPAGDLRVVNAEPPEADVPSGETTYRFELPHTR